MEITLALPSKTEASLTLDSVTVAEMLRVALYEQGVDFAAWKKEHYSKPVLMQIRHSAGVQKIVQSAIAQIGKQTDVLLKGLK